MFIDLRQITGLKNADHMLERKAEIVGEAVQPWRNEHDGEDGQYAYNNHKGDDTKPKITNPMAGEFGVSQLVVVEVKLVQVVKQPDSEHSRNQHEDCYGCTLINIWNGAKHDLIQLSR
ncbi:hypothetical protein D3C73_1153430 [compost metagenome]